MRCSSVEPLRFRDNSVYKLCRCNEIIKNLQIPLDYATSIIYNTPFSTVERYKKAENPYKQWGFRLFLEL